MLTLNCLRGVWQFTICNNIRFIFGFFENEPIRTDVALQLRTHRLDRSIGNANLRTFSKAALAQLVEHRIRNAGVGCSSHPSGTISFNDLAVVDASKSSLEVDLAQFWHSAWEISYV